MLSLNKETLLCNPNDTLTIKKRAGELSQCVEVQECFAARVREDLGQTPSTYVKSHECAAHMPAIPGQWKQREAIRVC